MNNTIPKSSVENSNKVLILSILQSAIREYLYPAATYPSYEKDKAKHSAHEFLFNDDYRIDWGDAIISPEELLREADIDIEYIRDRIRKKLKKGVRKYFKGDSLL